MVYSSLAVLNPTIAEARIVETKAKYGPFPINNVAKRLLTDTVAFNYSEHCKWGGGGALTYEIAIVQHGKMIVEKSHNFCTRLQVDFKFKANFPQIASL